MTQMQFCPCGRYFTLCRFFFFFLPRMTAAENTAWHKVNKQIIRLFTVLCQAGLFCHKCTHNWTSAWSLYFVFPRPVFVSLTEFCPEVWKFALWCKDKLLGFFLFLSFSCSAHGGCKILMLCSVTAVLSPVGLEWKKKKSIGLILIYVITCPAVISTTVDYGGNLELIQEMFQENPQRMFLPFWTRRHGKQMNALFAFV